jgi:hypothetical protein
MSDWFNNTIFRDLRERYPTWEQLEVFLESEEGGLFRVIDQKKDRDWVLIRYEKGVSNMDLPHSKWFRSVVWDRVMNAPLCVAPPKTTSTEFPFRSRQDAVEAGVVCQELLDGFMINCFKKVGDDTLHITSRSKLDAAGHFYSSKSFRHLFVEAYTGWILKADEPCEWLIQGESKNIPSPDPSNHEIATCFSFLVQHTEHRIVTPVTENSVTLIYQCTLYDDGTVRIVDTPDPTCIAFSRCLPLPSIPMTEGSEQIAEWAHEQLRTQPWTVQGIVFKDRLGNRWRYRSEAYNAVRSLRGNTSNVVDRFVQLYLQNLSHTYLEYYPEDAFVFSFHHEMMNYLIRAIYEEYQHLHVRRTLSIDKINKMYHPHLYAIHGYYLSQLRPANKKITLNDIHEYIRKQPWQRVSCLFRQIQDIYFDMIRENIVS